MGRVGRFICVGMPFALTVLSLLCILIVTLSGITNNGLFMFSVDTQNLSISTKDLSSLGTRAVHMDLSGSALKNGVNITAADLGLFDSYTVSLWNYCYTDGGKTTCTAGKFNWAANATNITTTLENLAAQDGASFSDPALVNSVKTFSTAIEWSEIVYIIAGVLAVAELIVGLFAFCSRLGSCCTFIVSAFSTVAIIAAAALSTATSAIVVGAVSAFNKFGVTAAFNTSFLSTSWLAVAFSLAASLFWLFSICCCAPGKTERKDKHRSRAGDRQPYGGYRRVDDPFAPNHGHQEMGYIPPTQPAAAQRYEPYSHHQV